MSNPIDDGGPAFPEPFLFDKDRGACGEYVSGGDAGAFTGMTLRDYFAARAMQAHLSDTETMKYLSRYASDRAKAPTDVLATMCYEYADAMLKARQE